MDLNSQNKVLHPQSCIMPDRAWLKEWCSDEAIRKWRHELMNFPPIKDEK